MKKTLLIIAVACMAFVEVNAQQIWNFGNDATNFPVYAGLGIGTGTPISTPGATETILGFTVSAGLAASATTGAVSAQVKSFTDANNVTYNFINRFLLNGAGYTGAAAGDLTPAVFTPTQRYASFKVSGNSTIYFIGATGSSGSDRTLFITDGSKLIGSKVFTSTYSTATPPVASATMLDGTINYTGPATTLYVYFSASIALYYMSATSVVLTGVNPVLTDKGVSFNGTEIVNAKGLSLEVYSVLGKRVASSLTSIPTANFQKGVYIVRVSGTNDSLKICI